MELYSKIDYYKLITQLTVLLLILFHKINESLHAQVTCYAWTFTNYEVTYTLVSLDKARITMTYTYRYNDWTEHSVSMERTATWARFTISKTYSVTRILLRKTTTKTNTVYQVKQTKPKQSCKSINFRKVKRFPFQFTLHVYGTLHLCTKNLYRGHSVKSFRCFPSINNSHL